MDDRHGAGEEAADETPLVRPTTTPAPTTYAPPTPHAGGEPYTGRARVDHAPPLPPANASTAPPWAGPVSQTAGRHRTPVVVAFIVVMAVAGVGWRVWNIYTGVSQAVRATAPIGESHPELAVLDTSPVVRSRDPARTMRVTSPYLARPFTLVAPKGYEGRLRTGSPNGAAVVDAAISGADADGVTVHYLVRVLPVEPYGLADMVDDMFTVESEDAPGLVERIGTTIPATVGGRPAGRSDYRINRDGRPRRGRLVVAVIGGRPVSLELVTSDESWSEETQRFSAFLSSVLD